MTNPKATIDVVVLTMNDRPEPFKRAMESLLAQQDVELRVIIVGNGVEPDYVPDGVRTVVLPVNEGIPAGRNAGADALAGPDAGEFVFFLDNDAVLPTLDTLDQLVAVARRHPEAAYVQPRIADPDTGVTMRRWVPRLRTTDVTRPGTVTVMAEGVVLIRRADYEQAGGWPGHFFLFHEGIDLSWRLWDLGRTGYYAPEIVIHHPATVPSRHADFYRLVARNRVWLAYRRLPAALVPVYLTAWTVLSIARIRSRANLAVWFAGLGEGLKGGHGQRRPMAWGTVLRLARAGRPPIV
ncbi:glycosyltransferase family 2 protein [Microtetraspora sp. AC03309]|uniref:glycosyltransferase family 2 protein n=1 Tax=Microtetraspora sp. AC03309 TaxID=2779376 RepID=UPI001E45591B|nr:glycosyltransferase [Microtetraspora sp. AC03309]MCC5580951.1 glycosyltransferase family 2 protein [Microtetraspora sp. AC03309]